MNCREKIVAKAVKSLVAGRARLAAMDCGSWFAHSLRCRDGVARVVGTNHLANALSCSDRCIFNSRNRNCGRNLVAERQNIAYESLRFELGLDIEHLFSCANYGYPLFF